MVADGGKNTVVPASAPASVQMVVTHPFEPSLSLVLAQKP